MGIGKVVGRVREYTRPRPTTSGDLATSSPQSGALGGAIEGYLTGGPVMAGAGLVAGYFGVKAGEKSGSFAVAVGSGALLGGALGVAGNLSLAALMNHPVAGAGLATAALLGAFTGAVGTLTGSRRASTRDGVYGGMMAGALANAFAGNPLLIVAGAAGGGIGGKAPTAIGRVILGGVAGAATGAVSGILGGPALMISSALIGGAVGACGALVGPVLRQVQRNATEDLTRKIISKLDPYVRKRGGLSTGQKVALAATAGALSLGPVGLLFGLRGLGIASAIGAISFGAITYNHIRKQKKGASPAPQNPPPSTGRGGAQGHSSQITGPTVTRDGRDARTLTQQEIARAWARGELVATVRTGSVVPPDGGAPPQPAVGPTPVDEGLERGPVPAR